MKKNRTAGLLEELLPIYQAAAKSNDGQRCMIAPSPEIRADKKGIEKVKRHFIQ